jgi:acyl-homoserine lactone acylase PvdQ
MGRVIQTGDTPAKKRNAAMRSGAEVIRLLAERPSIDEEAKDMIAFLVMSLRDVYQTIEESAQVWDERDYWRKSEALRAKWRWAHLAADDLEKLALEERWLEIPMEIIALVPHFSGVTITNITRDSDWWCGAYRALQKSVAKKR